MTPRHWSTWLVAVAVTFGAAHDGVAAPTPAPELVREKAAAVFERPEFQSAAPSQGNWFSRQFFAFFRWLGGLHEHSPPLFWLILIGCILALIAILVLIVFQIRAVFASRDQANPAGTLDSERVRRSAEFRQEATRLATAGDYTEAVRFLFLSLVYLYDERGRVSFHKEYTNREYLDLLGDRLPIRAALQVLVDTLDDHWYGQRACLRDHYLTCTAVYDRLAADRLN
jgi:uncharacterized membrane protein